MTAKVSSIIETFKLSFGELRGMDGNIAIERETVKGDAVDFELSIADGLDPEQVKARIGEPDYIGPAINLSCYDQFFSLRGKPVEPGYCTFEPYVENQRIHIRIDVSGVPFDMGA